MHGSTAAEPSPTAAATLFVDPERRSPTAKRPGWLVSNGNGDRSSVCHASPSWSRAQREVGQHEASVVKGCAAVEPAGGRICSDEGEQAGARKDALRRRGH